NIALGPPSVTFPQRVPKSNFKNLGVFIQDEYDVTRRLRVIGGLRIDPPDVEKLPPPRHNPPPPGIYPPTPPLDLSKLPSAFRALIAPLRRSTCRSCLRRAGLRSIAPRSPATSARSCA